MDLNLFLNNVRHNLSKLPGDAAHVSMEPIGRGGLIKEARKQNPFPRLGGVLIHVYPRNNSLHFVLIERQSYSGTHSGQIALPGGKVEEFDADITQTALREAEEEVNIKPSEIQVIGAMSPLYIPPSNFLVHPIVSFSEEAPNLIPEEKEVKSILEVPMKELLQSSVKIKTFTSMNKSIDAPYFPLQNQVVWGATAMILSEFRWVCGAPVMPPKS